MERSGRACLLAFLFGQCLALAAAQQCFPGIFNFGDSTSDTGGIQAAFPTFSQAEFPPYGMTYPGKPALRYSDGRLGLDFFCEALGLPYLSPYFQSVGSDYRHGVNFATAGATSQPSDFISPFSLNVQLAQFKEFKQRVLSAGPSGGGTSVLPSADLFSKALYMIDIAGNDFSYGYTRKMSFDQVKSYIHIAIEGINAWVKGIYAEGGRTMFISDIGPQGCVPYFLTNFPTVPVNYDSIGCAIQYNDVVKYYNNLLRAEVKNLQAQLPGSTLIYMNTFDLKYGLTASAFNYGFQYRTKACCGIGGNYNYNYAVQCGESKQVNGMQVTSTTCLDPSKHLNWDGVHYTDAANRIITRQLLTGKYFEPAYPLYQICKLRSV